MSAQYYFWGAVVLLCGIFFVALFVWGVFFSTSHMKQQKIKQLGTRTMMSMDEFYASFYAESEIPKELVAELLAGLGKALELPPGLLRPGDRFAVELAPLKGWGPNDDRLDLYDLLNQMEKKFKVKVDVRKINNVDGYIKTIGAAASSQH